MRFSSESVFKLCCLVVLLIGPKSSDCRYGYEIKSTPNTGTVLFGRQDVTRSCWAVEDIGLLLNRYIFQGILPLKPPTDMAGFLNYAMTCVQFVNDEVKSKNARRVLVHPMVDALGGYLRAFSIPTANELFYEGNVCEKTVAQLQYLYKDMQYTLKTDGSSWTPPMTINERFHAIKPLELNHKDFKAFCKQSGCCSMILFDTRGTKSHWASKTASKSDKIESETPSKKSKRKTDSNSCEIPMPFYDDCKNPHAIAVPLKEKSLYSMTSNTSYGVLTRYYKTAMYCLKEKCKRLDVNHQCKTLTREFNMNFYFWMLRNVMPLLQKSDTWYPAFYEVLRVFRTVDATVNDVKRNQTVFVLDEKSSQRSQGNCWLAQQQVRFKRFGSLGPILVCLAVLIFCFAFCCRYCYCSIKSNRDVCPSEVQSKSMSTKCLELFRCRKDKGADLCPQSPEGQTAFSDKMEPGGNTPRTVIGSSEGSKLESGAQSATSSKVSNTDCVRTNSTYPAQNPSANIEAHYLLNYERARYSNAKPLKSSSHIPKSNQNRTKYIYECASSLRYTTDVSESTESLHEELIHGSKDYLVEPDIDSRYHSHAEESKERSNGKPVPVMSRKPKNSYKSDM